MPPSNLLLASKIVVTEEPPSIRNIPAVATAIAAFEGVTERGPLRTPVFVTTWEEYQETFGGYLANSDLPIAVEGHFRNGGQGAWISRVVHYSDITDPNSSAAAKGSITIVDRGGVAGPAVLDSVAGPFDLEPGEVLEVNLDAAGNDTLTFTAVAASVLTGNTDPFALVNGDTIVYQVRMPGSSVLTEQRTITFLTAEFVAIGAATAEEVAAVINTKGVGISAEATGGGTTVTIRSDKKGSGARLVIDASSTAIAAGKLNISSGTTSGTGNVADVDAVTATEIAALLTALPLSSGTATVYDTDKVRLTSTGTGVAVTVVVTTGTTAVGIFTGTLPITETGSDAAESNTLTITGKNEGTHIESYTAVIEAATSGDSDRFNFKLTKGGAISESWPNLSMDESDLRYAEDFLTANSKLIDATDEDSPASSPSDLPKLGSYTAWTGADDGLTGLVDADYTGDQGGGTGLYAFDVVDNITILVVPGRSTNAVHNAMLTYCEVGRAESCFAILDTPAGLDEQQVKTYVVTTAALKNFSEYGAFYWPRIKILNPSTAIFGTTDDGNITVPPSGHVSGLYSRIDGKRPGGVYVPPAGVENGILFGCLGFETDDVLDESKRDVVFPERINPITVVLGSPRHVDGARTLKENGNFPSVSERRGVIFIRQSLKVGLLFAKHRNNDRRLRMEVKRATEAFLLRQYYNEAFRGSTPGESFYVDVSDGLNTIERIFAGELHMRIGLATQKPAEWVVIKITQDTRELEERLATELG